MVAAVLGVYVRGSSEFSHRNHDGGFEQPSLIEIVQHVALNIWTNYMNEVAKTEIDFPLAEGVAA